MRNYLNLLNHVLINGTLHENRTSIPTVRTTGAMLEFNLSLGFPAVTTKKLAFKAIVGELIGFIRGYTRADQFRRLGCGVWDANANQNEAWLANPNREGTDDLGRIYGAQWRHWTYGDLMTLDQLGKAIYEIQLNPQSRRIIVTAWQPAELDQMALPPCHLLFQYHVDVAAGELSMTMYQRSCDLFLGVPFNIASYALLLELTARAVGLKAGKLVMFLADVHIYKNHMDQVIEQLGRDTMDLPTLSIHNQRPDLSGLAWLEALEPADITLDGYHHHPAIKGEMAV